MHRLLSSLLLASLLLPSVARADPKDDARRHFAAGLKAAQEGSFEVALQRFLAAQEAYPHPATLYNIAKAYTDLDDLPNALTYYRLYRDAAPEKAADVDPVIAVLEARLGQAAAPDKPTGTEAPPSRAAAAAGPTEEELARLQTIARELEALTEALQTRAEEEAVAVTEAPEEVPEEPPEEEELPEIETGFVEEAYERVVVTASRVGQEPLDSPSSVSVLTADDIRLSGVTTLPDLLRRVVGIDAMMLSAGHTDVSIRGFNNKLNNKVLILIDGRSTYLDFIGTSLWSAFPVALEEVERIEVIRGPGSSVYGANAVTGVINIITRTPGEGEQVVRFDGGTPGLARGSAVASGRVGETAYRLSAGFDRHGRWARDYDLDDVASPAVSTGFSDDDQALDALRMNARVDRTLSDQVAVSVSAGMSQTGTEFYSIGALPNYFLDMRHHYLRGDLFVSGVHLRSFWNSNSGTTGPWQSYLGDAGSLAAEFDNDVVDVEVETPARFETGPVGHTLNVGAGYRYKRIAFTYLEGGFDNPWLENHFKGFVNEQIAIGPFGAVASLRADLHPLIPISQTLSPRGALLFRLFEKTSVRATAGSAYRAPNGIESYMDLKLPTPADGVFITDLGNQELRPERINTFELGVHDESSYFHTADVVVYLNQVTDLIFLDDVTVGIVPFDDVQGGIEVGTTGWVNLDPTYTGVGLEADAELYPTDGLDVFANLNLMRVIETSDGETVRDGSASTLKLNGGFSWRTPLRTDLSLTASYSGPQEWRLREFDPDTLALVSQFHPIDPRLLVSARVAVHPLPNDDLEAAFTVWNITELMGGDGFLEHPEGQPVIGRAYGSLTYRF